VLGQAHSTQRHTFRVREDEPRLVARIVELAREYGRYGYRRITALLRREGWRVNAKRVERVWFLHSEAGRAAQSCLVLRFRLRPDA